MARTLASRVFIRIFGFSFWMVMCWVFIQGFAFATHGALPAAGLIASGTLAGSLLSMAFLEPVWRFHRAPLSSTPPLDGHAFEAWVAQQMRRHGWHTRVTQGSGDQGLDVIAKFRGKTLGIQCKRYKGSVGNKAVQEAFAGCAHYKLDYAAVLTTGYYTKSARELAKSTGVLLLTVSDIPTMRKSLP